MSNKKTLVISDIHNRTRWIEHGLAELKKKYEYDEVVFLGDYFDSRHDNQWNAMTTAQWLKNSLTHTDRVHLMGNHDMPYRFPTNDAVHCPGFNPNKCRAINGIMTPEDWKKILPAYVSNGWLFSHAGFSPDLCTHPVNGPLSAEQLVESAVKGLEMLRANFPHPLFLAGSRMAEPVMGGITWMDWNDEAEAYPGVKQLVGHTPSNCVRTIQTPEGEIHCMDTGNQLVCLITDGVLEIIPNEYLA